LDSTSQPRQTQADLSRAETLRAHERWLATEGREGRRADLAGADLGKADLAGADLRRADLSRANLQGANLQEARLGGATMPGADLQAANLVGADFRAADLRGAQFLGADLAGAVLHESDLRDADLGAALGLASGQFGGANVAGARLPEAILKFEALANIQEAAKNLQNVFASVMLLCAYTWLTVASTKDAQLVNNTAPAASRLPILGTDIPLVRFYQIVPVALVCLYFYFQLGLQRFWEELADQPAVFPDGRPLDRKSYPWLMNGLIRVHVARLRQSRTSLDRWQFWLTILLAWCLVPLTLLMIWGRYLSGHDWTGSILHIAMLAASIGLGAGFFHLAASTLRGDEHRRFQWRLGLRDHRARHAWLAIGSLAFFAVLSYGGIRGINPHLADSRIARGEAQHLHAANPRSWVPRAFASIGFDTFATLDNADLSTKPLNWTGRELGTVKGADLEGRDLRFADAFGAFCVNACLKKADLRGADFREADLRGADLRYADLRGANLSEAKLAAADLSGALVTQASLREADLTGAKLVGADLRLVDLRGAKLVGADLASAQLGGADLSGADLEDAKGSFPPELFKPTAEALARKDKAP